MFCHFVFMLIVTMLLWLTQNNWLSSTKQNKAPYIPAASLAMSTQFHLS